MSDCPGCGKYLSIGASDCASCGWQVGRQAKEDSPSSSGFRRFLRGVGVLLLILATLVIVVAVYFFVHCLFGSGGPCSGIPFAMAGAVGIPMLFVGIVLILPSK
jgi:hypothetical protein